METEMEQKSLANKKKRKRGGKKHGKVKTVISFDENSRREFLLGFSKRKEERQKKAEEKMKTCLREDKIKLKSLMKKFRMPMPSIPGTDINDIKKNEENTKKVVQTYGDHTVTITDIDAVHFTNSSQIYLGHNIQAVSHEDESLDEGMESAGKGFKNAATKRLHRDIERLKLRISASENKLQRLNKSNSNKKKTGHRRRKLKAKRGKKNHKK